MVLFDAPTWPGVVIPSTPIGVVRLVQREGKKARERNDRVIAVPANDRPYRRVTDLPKRVRQGLEEFFIAESRMADKDVAVRCGNAGKAPARRIR